MRIPIIGLGGIDTAEDVLEYFIVGASAVQVGTASFANPNACVQIVSDLQQLCAKEKVRNINELRGTFQPESR